ncbi:MAG: PAS domain-containing protein [Acidobacteria bacterium]|nr:PAS domain-containing protein [Acidobacteriota bacterium]
MQLNLKTKFTLATALLVLGVVTATSWFYCVTLLRQVVQDTDDRARFIAQQVYRQVRQAIEEAGREGLAPASQSDEDLRAFVRKIIEENASLTALIEATVGYSPVIYEVSIVDSKGVVVISSDPAMPGQKPQQRSSLATLADNSSLEQIRALYGAPRVYEVRVPFQAGTVPFGDARVGISTTLLRRDIQGDISRAGYLALGSVVISILLAFAVSHFALSPLSKISTQLDRISQGQFDAPPVAAGTEFGQVSSKISQIGQQLRGVREIFSTLRGNLDQIMSGMEDGLLLFTSDGRAVLVSPSVEKFLGSPPAELLGRKTSEVFPSWHPLRQILRSNGDQLEPLSAAELDLDGAAPGAVSRIGINVQVIPEGAPEAPERMGTLVTLRDLDSLDRLGSEIAISERMAALGRVTAGVAHEVKNPLNSMRLWLENLKGSLPAAAPSVDGRANMTDQAVRILDSEIDRLDRVVKTFLDFTRPVDLALSDVYLDLELTQMAAVARPQIEKAKVELSPEISPNVPPVRADRTLIQQALMNLILNACEAMPSGGKITLALKRKGDNAEISISDTGCGIHPEHRTKIFQLFHTTHARGSGIGLATVFRIVQLHGGSIDFASEVGRGTTFRLELPLAH